MSVPPAPDNPTRSEPLLEEPERWLPRVSILSLIGLITLCAAVFWAIRTGFQGNFIALKSLVVIIFLVVLCFASYATLFLLTYLCSLILRPLVIASGQSLQRPRAALPTETLPAEKHPAERLPPAGTPKTDLQSPPSTGSEGSPHE